MAMILSKHDAAWFNAPKLTGAAPINDKLKRECYLCEKSMDRVLQGSNEAGGWDADSVDGNNINVNPSNFVAVHKACLKAKNPAVQKAKYEALVKKNGK